MKEGGKNASFCHTPKTILKIKERSNKKDNKERIRIIQKLAALSRKGSHHTAESKLKMIKTKFNISTSGNSPFKSSVENVVSKLQPPLSNTSYSN